MKARAALAVQYTGKKVTSGSKAAGKNQKSGGGFTYEVKTSDVKAGHLEAIVEGTASADHTPYFFAT